MNDKVYKGLLRYVAILWKSSDNLKSLYKASIDCPFLPPAAKERISQQPTNYLQNVLLKRELSNVMDGHYDFEDYNLAFWIINNWGGITSFKKNDKNKNRIQGFIESLHTGETTLNCISSLSKVASFMTPTDYFVYDSRVAYSLNWLLLKAGAKSGFFFNPHSQNKKLNHFSIEKIIEHEVPGNNVYLNNSITYDSYNTLIIKLYNDLSKIAKELKHAFELEMLLFQAAPWVIYQEITRKYSGSDLESSSFQANIARKKMDVNAFKAPGSYVVDAVYRHNRNGRQLVYPKTLSAGIIECWGKGGEVKLILDGQEIVVKRKPKDYGVFRQAEVNSWAKSREEQNMLSDKDTISMTVIMSLPDSSLNE